MSVKLEEPLGRVAYVNARLLDPASNLDTPGGVLVDGEDIVDFGSHIKADAVADETEIIDCGDQCLAPGLVDMRVQVCEPGEEHKGTLISEGRAAVAGGVTTFVCLPNTTPPIDDMSVLEFVARRARMVAMAKMFTYGAITKGLKGDEIAEMALLAESGAVAFTDGIRGIRDAGVLRQALSYTAPFGFLLVEHPRRAHAWRW